MTKDEAEAVRWFRKAASQGNPGGQFNLGIMLANGLGEPRDPAEALIWYRKAAEQGSVDAQFNLGSMLGNGTGVTRDLVQAYAWFSLSSRGGWPLAVQALAKAEQSLSPEEKTRAIALARDLGTRVPLAAPRQ